MPPLTTLPAERDNNEQVILGVDTHKDIHVAVVVSPLGQTLASASLPATTAGCRQLVSWTPSYGRAGAATMFACRSAAFYFIRPPVPTR